MDPMFKNEDIILNNEIRIIARDSFLDIVLLEGKKELSKIMLSENSGLLVSDGVADINFDDIIGVRSKGYGTKVMNSAIKYLKENYNPDLLISGIISDVIDQDLEEPLKIELKKRRRGFFKQFNFQIEIREPNNFDRISAKIGDLSEKL